MSKKADRASILPETRLNTTLKKRVAAKLVLNNQKNYTGLGRGNERVGKQINLAGQDSNHYGNSPSRNRSKSYAVKVSSKENEKEKEWSLKMKSLI